MLDLVGSDAIEVGQGVVACALYRDGRRGRDVAVEEIGALAGRDGGIVWLGLHEPDEAVPPQLIADLDHWRYHMAHVEEPGAQPIDPLDLSLAGMTENISPSMASSSWLILSMIGEPASVGSPTKRYRREARQLGGASVDRTGSAHEQRRQQKHRDADRLEHRALLRRRPVTQCAPDGQDDAGKPGGTPERPVDHPDGAIG
jgi:hypothetical protein